jgi:hypothetical protein
LNGWHQSDDWHPLYLRFLGYDALILGVGLTLCWPVSPLLLGITRRTISNAHVVVEQGHGGRLYMYCSLSARPTCYMHYLFIWSWYNAAYAWRRS